MSGEFGGTTATEIRERWNAWDLMDAHDLLRYRQAAQQELQRRHKLGTHGVLGY